MASNIDHMPSHRTSRRLERTHDVDPLGKKSSTEKGSALDTPILNMKHNHPIRSFLRTACGLGGALALNLGANCGAPPPVAQAIPADNAARQAFASQCAQNVINCTSSFPVAILDVAAGQGQIVTRTNVGFMIQGSDSDGVELVRFLGAGSLIAESMVGNNASMIFYDWTYAATDDDPCTLTPGPSFSNEANPQALLQVGVHYIRLHVSNDLAYGQESLLLEECGQIGQDIPKSDFEEVTIEIRD